MKKLMSAMLIGGTVMLGCSATAQDLNGLILNDGSQTQLQKRSYQQRAFENTDKTTVLRNITSVLLDSGYFVNVVDYDAGSLEATRIDGPKQWFSISAVVWERDKNVMVRLNIKYGAITSGMEVVEDPKYYQEFFTSLHKSLYLDANGAG